MKIPSFEMPKHRAGQDFVDEELIDLKEYFKDDIIIEPMYYKVGIEYAIDKCFVRKSVAQQLDKAFNSLDSSLTFKVFDAWRPISVQQVLFYKYYALCKLLNPDCDEAILLEEVKTYIAPPSYDITHPSVHNTGGAIDLTLVDKYSGIELNMGTCFDHFSKKSATSYAEYRNNEEVKQNRRKLYWTMIGAGFTNLPSEWWHYDYGDDYWSYYTKQLAKYRGIK